jgi:GT2 family glycosyltransferase
MTDVNENLTIVIKTFNRHKTLIRLLKSIYQHLGRINVIVLDDSTSRTSKIKIQRFINNKSNIRLLNNYENIGLSRGRNILVRNVKTKYFLLCDDDYEFTESNGILSAMDIIQKHDLDLLGGLLWDVFEINSVFALLSLIRHPSYILKILGKNKTESRLLAKITIDKGVAVINQLKFENNEVQRVDWINNFFIAKTESVVRMGGWQPEDLYLGEHKVFFIRAKLSSLKIGYSEVLSADHIRYIPLVYFRDRIMKITKYTPIIKDSLKAIGIKETIHN